MKTVPIVFAFDNRFEMPAGVCLTSLLENAAPDTFYDIFILHGSGSDFSSSKLNDLPGVYPNCRLTFRDVEGAFSGAHEIRGITEATYYKLVVPDVLPEYDKVLYSDVDVVFREDQARFLETDLGDNYFAAVDNCSALRPEAREYVASLGLDPARGYFYAGNLVINSALLRRDAMTDVFREMGKKKYFQQDMDIMNIACNGRILPLDPSFCMTVQLYYLMMNKPREFAALFPEEVTRHALRQGIVHYNGTKPWRKACLNMDIWWEYYRKSMWFDEGFCYRFWNDESLILDRLTLSKRLKLLLRYPYDRKHVQ